QRPGFAPWGYPIGISARRYFARVGWQVNQDPVVKIGARLFGGYFAVILVDIVHDCRDIGINAKHHKGAGSFGHLGPGQMRIEITPKGHACFRVRATKRKLYRNYALMLEGITMQFHTVLLYVQKTASKQEFSLV